MTGRAGHATVLPSSSIALDGAYEWPHQYQELRYKGEAPDPEGWYLECLNGWCLAAYPEDAD